jgi:hypothetical protein
MIMSPHCCSSLRLMQVDEALCFGWIDSVVQSIDDERTRTRITPRRPGGGWSKLNKSKVWVGLIVDSAWSAGFNPWDTYAETFGWSAVPLLQVEMLLAAGLMEPPGQCSPQELHVRCFPSSRRDTPVQSNEAMPNASQPSTRTGGDRAGQG